MNQDIIFRNEQKKIHSDSNILSEQKLKLIMNLFNERLSNAPYIELRDYIKDRKEAYEFEFAPKRDLDSEIPVEARRIRLLTRNEKKQVEEVSYHDASNSILNNVKYLIDLGRDSYGTKFYVSSGLLHALTVDYILKKNGKCRIKNQ